jgi:hypothetical protein
MGRTGQNTNETILTTSNVGDITFGRICSAHVDGQIHAQPLVVTNVNFNNQGAKTVAYVATENDSLYAINGTSSACTVLKQYSLLPPGERAWRRISSCRSSFLQIQLSAVPITAWLMLLGQVK